MYEYIIDIPFNGKAASHVKELAKELSEYNSLYSDIYDKYNSNKNIIHFTLKYWFELKNDEIKLFDEIEKLTNLQKSFNIGINDIKTFNNSEQLVIYADINRYKSGNNFVKKIMNILQKYDFVTWKDTDDKINGVIPHSTIAIVKNPINIQSDKIIKLLKPKLKKYRGKVLGVRIRRRLLNNKKGEKNLFKFYKFKK